MDSLSQFALGSAIGVLVMGREQSFGKSALLGGVCGLLPDADSFIDQGNAILNMVWHRAETHSLFWQTIAAPFIATLLALINGSLHLFFRWWVMVWLVLITHTGLDVMTVYGTRAFLPQHDEPFGLGSIFIIDPLYTLPLVFGVLLTLIRGHRRWAQKWTIIGLILSTAYLGWSYLAQQHVLGVVKDTPQARGLTSDQILVAPTPFNTVVWRVLLMREDTFDQGFYSLTDRYVAPERKLEFKSYKRGRALDRATADFKQATEVRKFSRGFYALSEANKQVRITDLRMGQEPYYVFSFDFAARERGGFKEVKPINVGARAADIPFRRLFNWIWARIQGREANPPE